MALSLGLGSVAHAMELVVCVDAATALESGHVDGDGDQVPADGDKGYPHHHGGCHGHHIEAQVLASEAAQFKVASSASVPVAPPCAPRRPPTPR
ncbi:hypothetical protein E6W36_01975 [Hankyongella ginsenosidimutans]|uniref:DUF2946 domain-containing protein n=1 Tax=Hankyongella ginsenosidimutans TaxID=1763828 RepID=A0A4D7C5G5_9SPHN|nr:hypothetical protein [Hankyongella ginsenosidimutans]QCI78825.1 hypothetical protein E6W36_01975 [Hankyongella ginsenosidimutans]